MKKGIAGLTLILLMALSVSAQKMKEGKRKHKGSDHREAAMKDLNLTEDQQANMKSVQADYRNKMNELNKNESITVGEMRAKKASINKERQSAVNNILTSEQQSKMHAKMKKGQKGPGHKGDVASNGDRLKKELALTADQEARMKNLNENHRKQIQELKNNNSLDADAKKQQMLSIRKKHSEDMKSILTPEQAKKMKKLRSGKTRQKSSR